jgi:hypothetical protein
MTATAAVLHEVGNANHMIIYLVVGECTQSRAGGIGVVVQLVGQGQCEVLDKWLVTYH